MTMAIVPPTDPAPSVQGLMWQGLPLDPVRDTQATFRVLLDALARPGQVRRLPVPAAGAPGNPWAAAMLLTLLDHETTLGLDLSGLPADTARYLCARTSARTTRLEQADFVLAAAPSANPALPARLKRGALAYPDAAATLVLTVVSLDQDGLPASNGRGSGAETLQLTLEGPGVPKGHALQVRGLPRALVAARDEATREYPLGIDVYLVDEEGRVVGLPRSTGVVQVQATEAR